MKEMIRFYRRKMCTSYSFNLVIATLVIAVSALFYQTYTVAQITLFAGIVYFLIPFVLYMRKLHMLKSFFQSETDLDAGDYKIIDNAVFTAEHVYAYSMDQMVKMQYGDIISVQHVDNIFEVARPGYEGNHKVVLKDKTNIISILVKDEAIAETLMRFIATKNPNVTLMNFHGEESSVQLQDLANWQVSTRF